MKSSFSQNSMYVSCPKMWDLSYNHKIKPIAENASLFFGSAIDSAISEMLKGNNDYLNKFYDLWNRAFNYGKATQIFDNDNVVYSNSDFDADVLKQKDLDQMLLWAAELGLGDSTDVVALFKEIQKIKKNPYKHTTAAQMKYFSRCSWLSLKRKGKILIESFKDQFLPRIEEVLAIQKYGKTEIPFTNDIISGYIDFVLKLKGEDAPIIFDLKTSAQPYTQDQIELTEQLTLYAQMAHAEFGTTRVGYIVLCKNINKESTAYCESCGHHKKGKFKNCNNIIEGSRCGGEWIEKKVFKPEVQVLIENKTREQVDDLMESYKNIVLAMKNKVVYKNTSRCRNHYGSICPYFSLCWKGDMKGLKQE